MAVRTLADLGLFHRNSYLIIDFSPRIYTIRYNFRKRGNRTMARPTVPELALAFGRALRARRRAQRVSTVAAADAAGMSRVTWSRIEHGETGVAWRFVLAAASAAGLEIHGQAGSAPAAPAVAGGGEWLPLKIHLEEFPGLQRLAWQRDATLQTLVPRAAWELYDRNRRHLNRAGLSAAEKALIGALGQVYGSLDADV